MSELDFDLTEEQEEELNRTVSLIIKGMMTTMLKNKDQNDWKIDLTGRSDWDMVNWHVAADAMNNVDGFSVVISEGGYIQTWSVDGRESK